MQFISACKTDSLESCVQLFNSNTPEINQNGLMAACRFGSLRVVKYLLSKSVDFEKFDGNELRPIHHACAGNHFEIVKLLISAGASVKEQTAMGETCLHFAAKHEMNKPLISLLLSKGANVNAQDKNGRSPIHLACIGSDEDMANLFVSIGNADLQLQDQTGWNVLHWAVVSATNTTVEFLLKQPKIDVNAKTKDHRSALDFACYNGRGNMVKMLLAAGADPKSKDMFGQSCLHWCGSDTDGSISMMLIQAGAHIDGLSVDGTTALHLASHSGLKYVVRNLIESGADVNLKIPRGKFNGSRPIHLAAGGNHFETVKLLVYAGANVNHLDLKGKTSLMIAQQPSPQLQLKIMPEMISFLERASSISPAKQSMRICRILGKGASAKRKVLLRLIFREINLPFFFGNEQKCEQLFLESCNRNSMQIKQHQQRGVAFPEWFRSIIFQ